jgi:prepilin-type N-terminal cleavage/methylation domain-containing protein
VPCPPEVRRRSRRGFSLVELLVVMTVLAVAVAMLTNTLAAVMRLEPASRETGQALDAARSAAEELRATPFGEIFATWDADPADDPGGPGSARGAGFAAFPLLPQAGDPDGLVGRVELPAVGGELREDVVDAELGMPRDLNLDGVIDAADHAGDYEILPFRVVLEWRNAAQARRLVTCSEVVRP